MIRAPEAGSALSISVYEENGDIKTYKLALVRDDSYLKILSDHEEHLSTFDGGVAKGTGENPNKVNRYWHYMYDYVFLADDGTFARGAYGGGNTGSGINPYETRPLDDKYTVLSTDPKEIMRLATDIEQAIRGYDEDQKNKAERKEQELKKAFATEETPIYESDSVRVYYRVLLRRGGGVDPIFTYETLLPEGRWSSRDRIDLSDLFTPTKRVSTRARRAFGVDTKGVVPAIVDKTREIRRTAQEIRDRQE